MLGTDNLAVLFLFKALTQIINIVTLEWYYDFYRVI